MEEIKRCRRCHRELKDEQSKELGFGKICYTKYMNRTKTYLFDMGVNHEIITKKGIQEN